MTCGPFMSISAQFPALLAHPAAFCTTTAFEIAEAEIPTPELRKRGPNGPLLVLFKFGSDRDSRRLRPSGSGARGARADDAAGGV
jgi:hypothetical protein